MTSYKQPLVARAGGAGITSVIAAALALAVPAIMQWEGKRNVAYADVAGVPTVCWGHTDAGIGRIGDRKTDAECAALLDRDLQAHIQPILGCVPELGHRPRQLAASTSLAFNIGTRAFCGSTAARRFNAGDWRGGCDAFRMWTKAGGRVVRGLVRRREDERRICLEGLS